VQVTAPLSPQRDEVGAEYDKELFERLRLLRKKIADEQGVPPFVVFGDLALQQMALYLPQSEENFARISGVGDAKLQQYGKIFTEVIRTFAKEKNLAERDIPVKRSARPRRANRLGPTYRETQKLILQKMPLEQMAEMRGFSAGTIIAHIEKLVGSGEAIDIDYLRPPLKRFEKIKAAFQQANGMSLRPVSEMLGEQFSFEELKIARIFIKEQG
jgi:ATP-dependent DNA helicase RecQ